MNAILGLKSKPVIEVEILKPVRIKDFETGLFAGKLLPGKAEACTALKGSRKIWILIRSDSRLRGLPRKDWLLHWHENRIEIRRRRGENWREYFNDKLKRDQL